MGLFWVYMLEMLGKNNKKAYYIGYTSNLIKRIAQHKSGKGARYTKGKKIIKLVYTESYSTRSEAMKREIALKKLKHVEKSQIALNYSSVPKTE